MNQPKIIGLTGGIGSGKSTIAKVFKALGVPVFNSDTIAKEIINSNIEVISEVKALFGNVYNKGVIDKVKMADIVFRDKLALEKLNNIIHPVVATEFENWIKEHQDEPILIKEAAILIESGAYKKVDKVVLVIAPETLRIKRVIVRDGSTKEQVYNRINAQLSDKDKEQKSNFIIYNDGNKLVVPQVIEVYKWLTH